MMKLTNSWRVQNKQTDRIEARLRLGAVTVFEVTADLSSKKWRIGAFNFFLGN